MQRETIFCEAALNKPHITHQKRRELNKIVQYTGISVPQSARDEEVPKRPSNQNTYSKRNLNQTVQYYTPLMTSTKAKGEFHKDPLNQSTDVNLLGIQHSKKHFAKTDNIINHAVSPSAARVILNPKKHERVKGYMNSDQIKQNFTVEDIKHYRGLLG